MNSVGERLNYAINTLHLSKSEFAKTLGRSTGNISDWLSNKCKPGKRSLEMISSIFNISKEWLIYGTGEMFNNTNISNKSVIDQPASTYNSLGKLSSKEIQLIQCYREMSAESKGYILGQATLLATQNKNTETNDNTLSTSSFGKSSTIQSNVG